VQTDGMVKIIHTEEDKFPFTKDGKEELVNIS